MAITTRSLDCGLGPAPGSVFFFAISASTGHSAATGTGGIQRDARPVKPAGSLTPPCRVRRMTQ